ncbi:MAG: pectinesterase family protein, partial [Candidatus Ornithomonoglobus sp.]
TVKDFNIINSIPVMVTAGEKAAHVAPEADRKTGVAASYDLPTRDALSICDENTEWEKPTDVLDSNGVVDKTKYKTAADGGRTFTAGESAFLAQSSGFNERGHAISINGDKIILENVRVRGNQDSIYFSNGRIYFKDCDLLGGTDYIYGSATAVFDNCKLGIVGMSDKTYGSPIVTPNTDKNRKYGALFYNCTAYNLLSNVGESNFGGPWGADAQATFFNTTIDDAGTVGASPFKLAAAGWARFGAENGLARLYEYGTKNSSGNAVDYSKRVVNKSVAEGGTGMGTVLDEWQILEFNPRNYWAADCGGWADDWDPMGFGTEYLTEVDAQIAANSTITVPGGTSTSVALPQSSDDKVEFHYVSASLNAVVSDDEKSMTITRPAAGEPAIETTVILYARNTETKFGDKVDIPVTISATTDTTNVFNIPVTVTSSVAAAYDSNFEIKILKDGALIKTQTVTIPAGETSVTDKITNVPSNASGIVYDVKITPESDELTITAPEDGVTKITGVTDKDIALDITAQKLVDETVTLDIDTTAAAGNKTYDLISLAKKAGADASITSSDIITVSYDVAVNAALTNVGYIDINAGTPSNSNAASTSRFALAKLNNSWTQIDIVDCSQGFSGASNGGGQCLNVTGKFDYATKHTITTTINYKTETVTIDGSSSGTGKTATPYSFENFPTAAAKGTLNMGVFVNTADNYQINNVQVTYKKIVTDAESVEAPKPAEYQGTTAVFGTGNQCTGGTFTFTDGADADAQKVFADSLGGTTVKASLTEKYLNYIGGTETEVHPTITYTTPLAGPYKIYYLGYNSGKAVQATIGDTTYMASSADFATDGSKTLKLYTIEAELRAGTHTIVFDDKTSSYLPDLYSVVIVYDGEITEPTPTEQPTEAPAQAEIVAYYLDSKDYDYTVLTGGENNTPYTDTVNGLSGYGAFTKQNSSAKYTYTDVSGKTYDYSFTMAWQAGLGGTTNRCLYFTPKSKCKVTVAYGAETGRPVKIAQNGTELITGEEGVTDGVAASISAEITDTSVPVYVYGGSSNKSIYAIIVEYYAEEEQPTETPKPITGGTGDSETSEKNLADLVQDASEGSTEQEKTVTIVSADDQGTVTIPSDVKVVIKSAEALKNTTLKAENDTTPIEVTVKDNDNTTIVSGAEIKFGNSGKITPAEDIVIKTVNEDSTVDMGIFGAGSISGSANKIKFIIKNSAGETAEAEFDLKSSVKGNVIIGLFIKSVAMDETLSIDSITEVE